MRCVRCHVNGGTQRYIFSIVWNRTFEIACPTKTPNNRKDKLGQISLSSTVDITSYLARILLVEDSLLQEGYALCKMSCQRWNSKIYLFEQVNVQVEFIFSSAVSWPSRSHTVARGCGPGSDREGAILHDFDGQATAPHGWPRSNKGHPQGRRQCAYCWTHRERLGLAEDRIFGTLTKADAVLTEPLSRSHFEHAMRRFMPTEILYD